MIPPGAPAQLGGVNVPDVEAPSLPESPLEPAGIPPVTSAQELIDAVEQETGIDIPGVGGQPSGQPPQSGPDEPASTPPPASVSTTPPTADPEGGTITQGFPEAASSPPASPQSRESAGQTAREDPTVRSDRSPARFSEAGARGEEVASPVRRVFEAIGSLPWALLAVIAVLALLGLAMVGRSSVLVRLTRRLTNQGDELREDVGALQTALLPTIPARVGSVELSVAYRAAEGPAAGGDFHDVLPLDGERVAIIVGDVCGHGREALTITALVHYTVRAYLEAGMQPRQALRLADEALGSKLGRDFATVLLAIYDSERSTLDYATAGHPVPVILGEESDHAVPAMTPPPIGIGPCTGFRQTRVALTAGSRVCFFTDGLIEQRDGDGAMLGREGLARSLAELDDRIEAEAALDRLAGSAPAADDMTVCLARPLRAAGDGTVVEELELEGEGDPKYIAEFLQACGLDADETNRALEEIGVREGSALLRVRHGGERSAFEVTEPAADETLARVTLPSASPAAVLAS